MHSNNDGNKTLIITATKQNNHDSNDNNDNNNKNVNINAHDTCNDNHETIVKSLRIACATALGASLAIAFLLR